MNRNIRNIALLACSGLALASCAANPGPVINKSTDKLISYFEAKQELANTLQRQLGGPTASSPRNAYYTYRLVAINGPSYNLGSVLAVGNSLDLVTRRCTTDEQALPFERWSSMPRWSSNSNLNTALGIPAPLRGVFDKTSVDAGLNFDSTSIYQIEDIGQRFLARDELFELTTTGECGEYLATLTEPVVFVRGIIYGRETLKSAKGFGANLDARIIEGESGAFNFKFDRSGAYELSDAEIVPKFAIMAKIVPAPRVAAAVTTSGDPAEADTTMSIEDIQAALEAGDMSVLANIEPAAGGPATSPSGFGYPFMRFDVAPLSDEEVEALEAGGPGN